MATAVAAPEQAIVGDDHPDCDDLVLDSVLAVAGAVDPLDFDEIDGSGGGLGLGGLQPLGLVALAAWSDPLLDRGKFWADCALRRPRAQLLHQSAVVLVI